MNERNQVNRSSAEKNTGNEIGTGKRIEAIVATVSHLQSEAQLHNPIAAYFLEMCRFSLLNPDLRLERYPLLQSRRG
jgi:hypothetical protein